MKLEDFRQEAHRDIDRFCNNYAKGVEHHPDIFPEKIIEQKWYANFIDWVTK